MVTRAAALSAADAEPHRAYEEVFLNQKEAAASSCIAEAIAYGHSVLVQKLATPAECKVLKDWATSTASIEMEKSLDHVALGFIRNTGRVRMPIARMLGADSHALCEELLLRSLALLEEQAPTLNTVLLGGCPLTLAGNAGLSFAAGEPAINVYTEGGGFKPHEDKQSLTILTMLSDGEDGEGCEFDGGGTAFWSAADKGTDLSLLSSTQPTMVLKPQIGASLIFGGQVTHSGVRVLAGKRCVFVASLSKADPFNMNYSRRAPARWDSLLGRDVLSKVEASRAAAQSERPSGHVEESERSKALRRQRAAYEERVAQDKARQEQLKSHQFKSTSGSPR